MARQQSAHPARVGIAMSWDRHGELRPNAGETHYLARNYVQGITLAGGLALALPAQAGPEALIAELDALILPGGDDFAPERPDTYPSHVEFSVEPAAKLDFDRALLRLALQRGMPILGICYGMQLLALELGGRLHYDIASDVPAAGPHQLPRSQAHRLVWESPISKSGDSDLRHLIGDLCEVNSRHHQALADPGPHLRVSARAPDGIIEAVEAPDRDFCIGVQWHPEDALDSHGRSLFEGLVTAAERFRRTTVAPQPPRSGGPSK